MLNDVFFILSTLANDVGVWLWFGSFAQTFDFDFSSVGSFVFVALWGFGTFLLIICVDIPFGL